MRYILLLALLLPACAGAQPAGVVQSERAQFRVTTLFRGLENPWGGAFLPDGRLLVTERPGRMRLLAPDGTLSRPLEGVPEVEARGQGGLLDVALAPDFSASRELWFCQAALTTQGALTRFVRARLSADARGLEAVTPVLDATPGQSSGRNHYGCRIAFAADGQHVFLSTGERYERDRAQKLNDLGGKILRLTREGRIPADNPFVGQTGARGEIWSLGHRNPQGLAVNPASGTLFEAEFGARGGDEVNVIQRGRNYGWPLVTNSIDYDGSVISDRRSAPGFEDPLRAWTPSINPSGVAFYNGAAMPGWRGSLLMAGLSGQLIRLTIENDRIAGEERLLPRIARFRHVVVSPEGRVHILTDERDGRVLRLDPA
ncbi:PQQ-dependent sugar dehydrogenase [Plastoroseomonas arctica]|uniref:PQQ-dependent sugar dehydrogenase n=1 Tax=Plastoroseomonas arctica TaxID=1509237 RepID=A0AAF1JZC9_9PROT|nr:PQQ-dependent sugar dehydrogenase [Plastoroseomonas arctica]MBR0654294.1 PQQ-dependent sugar dehydrogenase [Plastoroseomonas arctica]